MAYAFALAYEKSLEEHTPQNAQAMRMIISELSRVYTHIYGIKGTLKVIQWETVFGDLHDILKPLEIIMQSIYKDHPFLPLGFSKLFNAELQGSIQKFTQTSKKKIKKLQKRILANALFKLRTVGVGVLSKADCLSYAVSGLSLRSAGIVYDYRQAKPYDLYKHVDFSVPVGSVGDAYERTVMRFRECLESLRIIEQVLSFITPEGVTYSRLGQYFLNPTPPEASAIFQMKSHYIKHNGIPVAHDQLYGMIEGGRGQTHFSACIDAHRNTLQNVSVRYGSYFNGQLISFLIRNCDQEDVDLVMASLDISPRELDR